MSSNQTLSRRAFLAASGALVVTLTGPEPVQAAQNNAATRPPLAGDQLSSYLSIEPDGTVIAYYGKIDGGQGLGTSIAQMVAEEIDVPLEKVHVVMGDSGLTLDMGGASAAIGVSHGGMVLRRTAAQARQLLIELAAQVLGRPADELTVTDGVVHATGSSTRGISYGELIGGRYFEQKVKWNGKTSNALGVETTVPLKMPGRF